MKLFIYGLLELIKNRVQEKCVTVEEYFSQGIASILYSKYSNVFDSVAFHPNYCKEIDEYYKNYTGIANGNEHKYACKETDGLYLVIVLALEKLY